MLTYKIPSIEKSSCSEPYICMVNIIELDPRDSMKTALPNWVQPLLTSLTAKPFTGEQPRARTALNDVVQTFATLVFGVSISVLAIYQSGLALFLLLFGWILTVYSLRKLRLTIMHACSHYTVFNGRKKLNRYLGEFISILTLTLDFNTYQKNHTRKHHSRRLMTPGDETYEYLHMVGFRLGMSVEEAWIHLWRTILSPTFYARQVSSRLINTFLSSSTQHNQLSFIFWSTVLGSIALTQSWLFFLIVWIIPITIFFEASSLLRQCVEHRFPPRKSKLTPEVMRKMTTAIFCGEQIPKLNASDVWVKRFFAWTQWWMRMLFYHLPSRVLILTGDSAGGHDWHHRNPGSREWINCIFERQKEIDSGAEYYHTWGLLAAINETFKSLNQISSI